MAAGLDEQAEAVINLLADAYGATGEPPPVVSRGDVRQLLVEGREAEAATLGLSGAVFHPPAALFSLEDLARPPARYAYGCVLAPLPPELAQATRSLACLIDPDDLSGGRVEGEPHLTLLYGVHEGIGPDDIRPLLSGLGPCELALGQAAVFADDGQRGSDVLYLAVHGEGPRRLHRLLADGLPATLTHTTYRPHITLAYLRPGRAARYAADPRFRALAGRRARLHGLVYADARGQRQALSLSDGPPSLLSTEPEGDAPEGDEPEGPAVRPLADQAAEAILGRARLPSRRLAEAAIRELAQRLHRLPPGRWGPAVREVLGRYAPAFGQQFSDLRLAALLEGMRRLATSGPSGDGRSSRTPSATPATGGSAGAPPPEAPLLLLAEEAARDLRQRQLLAPQEYQALAAQAKKGAFTVAGAHEEAILAKVRDALADLAEAGPSLEAFERRMAEEVAPGTFLSPAHLENVYRTNIQSAFSLGQDRLVQSPLVADLFPYVETLLIDDDRATPLCREVSRSGIGGGPIYRRDDPVWHAYNVPRHFG